MVDSITQAKKQNTWFLLTILGVAIAAFCLRIIGLDNTPLNDIEAVNALSANEINQHLSQVTHSQPLYNLVTSRLFWISGGTNSSARLLPVVVGSLLCLLPAMLKKELGSSAIIVSILFAVDPGLVAVSRQADSAILAIFFIAATGLCIWKKKAVLAGFFLGLALMSGARFWILALSLLVSWGLYKLIAGRISLDRNACEVSDSNEPNKGKINFFHLFMTCFIVIILMGTLFFTDIGQLNGIAGGLLDYLRGWKPQDELNQISTKSFLLTYLASSAYLILFSFFGLIRRIVKKNPQGVFLGILSMVLILSLIIWPSRRLSDVSLISLPVIMLCAFQIEEVLRGWKISPKIILTTIALQFSLLIFAYLNMIWILRNYLYPSTDLTMHVIAMIAAIMLIIATTILEGWGWNWNVARAGILFTLMIAFTILLVAQISKVIDDRVTPVSLLSSNEVLGESLINKSIDQVAFMNGRNKDAIDIAVEGIVPDSLQWVLIKHWTIYYPNGIPPLNCPSIIISLSSTNPELACDYRGQKFEWSTENFIDNMTFPEWLNWIFLHKSIEQKTPIYFWVRSDMLPDSY